jgi:hypothetical protein
MMSDTAYVLIHAESAYNTTTNHETTETPT